MNDRPSSYAVIVLVVSRLRIECVVDAVSELGEAEAIGHNAAAKPTESEYVVGVEDEGSKATEHSLAVTSSLAFAAVAMTGATKLLTRKFPG